MSKNPSKKLATQGVAGLSEVLLALGAEIRKANSEAALLGLADNPAQDVGDPDRDYPVLFLEGASVELSIKTTRSVDGGVDVWVVSGQGHAESEYSGKITVHLNNGGHLLEIGQ